MSLVQRVARRFVFDRKANSDPMARGFVSFIALISISGLALGVTALLVVTSVFNGFERELKKSLTAFHGHVLLFSRAEPISDSSKYVKEIKANFPDVVAVSPYIFAEVMLSSSKGVSGAVIEGIDLPSVGQVSRVEQKLIQGRLPSAQSEDSEIALGAEICRKLHVTLGDTVILTVPFGKNGDTPIVQKLKVSGVVRLGMYDYDSKYALMEMKHFQQILDIPDKVNAFKILTKDPSKSYVTTTSLNEKYLYPLRARDWSTLNRNLFYAIALQKAVITTILMAIVLVASFNIISTIFMMVHDKKRQIAMLKALGWTRGQTLSVFLLIGSSMSFLGTLLGLGFGRTLCGLVQWKSIIDLPADIYLLSRLPIEIRPIEWFTICVLAVCLAVFSSLWPSYKVSRQSPIEGLRYE